MNAVAGEEAEVHIGSVIRFGLYSDAEENAGYAGKPDRFVTIKIVGIVVFSGDVIQDDIDALSSGQVLLTPALTRELAPSYSYYSYTALRLTGGAVDAAKVEAEVSGLLPHGVSFGAYLTSATEAKAERAVKPEAIALAVFGGIVALAALLIAAQIVGRQERLAAEELDTLRALGAAPFVTSSDGLIGILGAVVVGSGLAVVVAAGLSPIAPLGVVRPVYPTPGIAFDLTVLGAGFALLVLVLGMFAVLYAHEQAPHRRSLSRRQLRRRHSALVQAVASSPLPIPAVTGFRFALEPGGARTAAPVRSAIFGTALAVVILTATLVFGASLDKLVSHPSLYGWNWNYAMLSGFTGAEDLPAGPIASLLDKDRYVEAWSGVHFILDQLDGRPVPMMTEQPGVKVAPPLLSGHGLDASDQVVLGAVTLAELHERIGDSVTLDTGYRKERLVIVGTATMPSMGGGGPGNLEMGSGALLATSDFAAATLDPQRGPIPGPNAVLIRTRPGSNPLAAYRSLVQVNTAVNALPNDDQPAGGVISLLRPAEIVNYRSMGSIPAYLGFGLALGPEFGATFASSQVDGIAREKCFHYA